MYAMTQKTDRLQTRRTLRAHACLGHVGVVASGSGVVAMWAVRFTAKINPSGTPGGDPNRGDP
jgi:hypothetical protein